MPSLMETIKNLYKQETVQEEKKEILEQDDDVVEKEEMALSQLYFIEYAAEEIIEYIEEMDGEVEEWYQNKLSKIHSDMESLHSHVEGEKRRLKLDDDEDEDDEMEEQTNARVEEKRDPPFTPDKPKKNPGVVPGKHGVGPSLAKHLAKKGMQKQLEKNRVKEEVELDEMDKSQPSSSRGAEGVPVGKKADPVKTDKVKSDAFKVLQKAYKDKKVKVKEDVEDLEELSKTTLASYAKKAAKKSKINQTMADRFEKDSERSRNPNKKIAIRNLAKDYQNKAWKREDGYNKAIDRLAKEDVDLEESHFKVGQKVECIKSGMKGVVTKVDSPEEGKYYTVKQESGKIMKYAPDELKALNEELETETLSIEETIKRVILGEKLHPNQKKLDVDKDGDIEADDLADLRAGKHKKKEEKVGKGKEQIDLKPKLDEKAPVAPVPDEETIHEEEMSDAEMKKREEIVKSLKKRTAEFKDRYGDRWKDVMYATATKMAMK